jgi:hypothetical protein
MSSDLILKLSRYFFAIPLAAFGVQYLVYGHFVGGLPPVPPWTPGGAVLAYPTGLALIASGWHAREAAGFIGAFFTLCVVFLHLLHLTSVLHSGVDRMRALEPLAFAAVAFALAIFGLQHFWYAAFIATLIPSWMSAHLFLAYFTGVAFIATGLSLVTKVLVRLSAALLALMFLLWLLRRCAPRVMAHLRNGNEWSSMLVALAMSGSALFFASRNNRT